MRREDEGEKEGAGHEHGCVRDECRPEHMFAASTVDRDAEDHRCEDLNVFFMSISIQSAFFTITRTLRMPPRVFKCSRFIYERCCSFGMTACSLAFISARLSVGTCVKQSVDLSSEKYAL